MFEQQQHSFLDSSNFSSGFWVWQSKACEVQIVEIVVQNIWNRGGLVNCMQEEEAEDSFLEAHDSKDGMGNLHITTMSMNVIFAVCRSNVAYLLTVFWFPFVQHPQKCRNIMKSANCFRFLCVKLKRAARHLTDSFEEPGGPDALDVDPLLEGPPKLATRSAYSFETNYRSVQFIFSVLCVSPRDKN